MAQVQAKWILLQLMWLTSDGELNSQSCFQTWDGLFDGESYDITLYKILAAFPTQLTLFSKMASNFAIWLVVASLAYFQVSTIDNVQKDNCMLSGNSQTKFMSSQKQIVCQMITHAFCILYKVSNVKGGPEESGCHEDCFSSNLTERHYFDEFSTV